MTYGLEWHVHAQALGISSGTPEAAEPATSELHSVTYQESMLDKAMVHTPAHAE